MNTDITKMSPLFLWTLCLPVMLACIDVMAVSVALNNILSSFPHSSTELEWLLSSYMIGTAAFLITIGRLADHFGRRRLLLIGVILFGLSSAFAGFSPYFFILIVSRFFQGIASAILMTTVISIITHSYSPEARVRALAIWGLALGVAMALGPLAGGLLLHITNWRFIFFINIPLCIYAYLMIFRVVPESQNPNALPIDWYEALLLNFIFIGWIVLLSEMTNWGWLSHSSILLFLCCATLSLLYYKKFAQKPAAIINFSLFQLPNFLSATLSGALSYFTMYAWLYIYNLYLQQQLHLSALRTGIWMAFFSLAFALCSRLSAKIMTIFGNRRTLQLGFCLMFCVFILLGFFTSRANLIELGFLFFMLGTAIVFANTPSINSALQYVSKEKAGTASGIVFTIRWLGGAIGVTVVALEQPFGIQICCWTLCLISLLGFLCSFGVKNAQENISLER